MNSGAKSNQGIIGLIVLLIIAILVASYFGINIKQVAESDTAQTNFGYIKQVSVNFWNEYLAKPVDYVYNDIWLNLCWRPFVDNLERLKAGRPTTLEPPTVDLR